MTKWYKKLRGLLDQANHARKVDHNLPLARDLYRQALNLYEDNPDPLDEAWVLNEIFDVMGEQGDFRGAANYGYEALRSMDAPDNRPFIWEQIGRAEKQQANFAAGRHAFVMVVGLLEDSPDFFVLARVFYEWGLLEADDGNPEAAIHLLHLGELMLTRLIDTRSDYEDAAFYQTWFITERARLQALLDAQHEGGEA